VNDRIEVEVGLGEGVTLPITLPHAEAAVRHVLSAEGVQVAEISVAFVGDEEIARLNEEYLAHEGTTDVISFALHAAGESPLGDIYVGVDQAGRQAAEVGVPVADELFRLVIHGTLHVLGYDHPEGPDRAGSVMYRRQEELLTGFLDRIGAQGR